MHEIRKDKIKELARKKMGGKKGLDFEGSDGVITSDEGRIIVVPATNKIKNLDELKQGTIIAGIDVEYAPANAPLKDGYYEIKLMGLNGGWIAQFIKDNQVITSTTHVRVTPSRLQTQDSEVTILAGSPVAVFLGGVILGMIIGVLLMK